MKVHWTIPLDESEEMYSDSAEKLLVFKKKVEGNATLKKRYRGTRPFKLINKGKESILATLGLENSYEIL